MTELPGLEPDIGLFGPVVDPVHALLRRIEGRLQGVHLWAAPLGGGVSRGLCRLRDLLRRDGRVTVEIAALEGMAAEPSGLDFVVRLATALDQAVQSVVGPVPGPTAWERVARSLPGGLTEPNGGARAAVEDLLLHGHNGRNLGTLLAGRAGQLRRQLAARQEDLSLAVRPYLGPGLEPVVLCHGLSQTSSPQTRSSVDRFVLRTGAALALPEWHVVVDVPASLWTRREDALVGLPMGTASWWPALPIHRPDGQVHPKAIERLRSALRADHPWATAPGTWLQAALVASGGLLGDLSEILALPPQAAPTPPVLARRGWGSPRWVGTEVGIARPDAHPEWRPHPALALP